MSASVSVSVTASVTSSVFEVNTILEFHNTSIPHPLDTNSLEYGKLEVFVEHVVQPSVTNEVGKVTWDIVFSVDNSGSMSDKCKDNRTKMQNIVHTLSNIVRLFSQKDPSAYCFNIYIQTFNNVVTKVLDFTQLTAENMNSIIERIETIVHEGHTNLVAPLEMCKTLYKERKSAINSQNIFLHIVVTDGEDNCNSESVFDETSIELQYASEFKTIFIGIDVTHDCEKLSSFVSKNNDNEYYFIDKMENAGIVYGEIVHHILNVQFIKVKLSIENGLLYNWKTNTWTASIDIGDLYANTCSSFHVKSKTPEMVKGYICGVNIHDNKYSRKSSNKSTQLDEFTPLPHLLDAITGEIYPIDLTPYMYRYNVQSVLYKCVRMGLSSVGLSSVGLSSHYDKDHDYDYENPNNKLKRDLADLFTEMKEHKDSANPLWNLLLDDIFIAYKTINTPYFYMFAYARYISQGLQRAYAANHIQDLWKDIQMNIGRDANYREEIVRSTITTNNQTLYTYVSVITPTYNDEEPHDNLYTIDGVVGYVGENGNIYTETIRDCLEDEIIHELTDSINSPYMTQEMREVMHSLSC
jgi:uncharacterized protein YegL